MTAERHWGGERRVFFFSSRRRHTRWTGDWSSDVCSSDLGSKLTTILDTHLTYCDCYNGGVYPDCILYYCGTQNVGCHVGETCVFSVVCKTIRSEERRVGKAYRDRWWTDALRHNAQSRRIR